MLIISSQVVSNKKFSASHPSIFRSIAERKSIQVRSFILKPFGGFLLAFQNSDLLKVDVAECNCYGQATDRKAQDNSRSVICAVGSAVVFAFGRHW